MKQVMINRPAKDVLITLLLSSGVSVVLMLVRILATGSLRLSFLVWNLFLAWLPLLFAYWLKFSIDKKKLPSYKELALGALWLVYLPNSFYLMTDLIHLQSSAEVGLLYDTALLTSFVINGLILGFISLYIVHGVARKLIGASRAYLFAQLILLLCGFAIYLGRYLRWNTWDVLINPFGLVFDVSDRIINPTTHAHTFLITGVFYIVLGSSYAVIYRITEIISNTKQR